MTKQILPDGWDDCISVLNRKLDEQLKIETESARKFGNEPSLFISSFRKVVDKVLENLND